MEGELNELCERLDATELEQELVKVDIEQFVRVVSKGANCMLVKLHTQRSFNCEVFKATMRKIWRPTKPMKFHEVRSNLIMVEFEERHDKLRIIQESPWNFNWRLVFLSDFKGVEPYHYPRGFVLGACP